MSTLEVVALLTVGVWLLALSFVVVLLVRQVALVGIQLQSVGTPNEDGLPVGTPVPANVTQGVLTVVDDPVYLLFVSPTCAPCMDLVSDLRGVNGERIVALFPGNDGRADEFARRFPPGFELVRDPRASEIAEALRVRTAPYALQIERGIVTGKATVQAISDLVSLMNAHATSDAVDIAKSMREVLDSAN